MLRLQKTEFSLTLPQNKKKVKAGEGTSAGHLDHSFSQAGPLRDGCPGSF